MDLKYKAHLEVLKNKDKVCILYECACVTNTTKHLHHPDYSQPFLVVKLCPSCHFKEHVRLSDKKKALCKCKEHYTYNKDKLCWHCQWLAKRRMAYRKDSL